ncbi:hypothetical protein GTO89_00715 [Heliobacterium gestii]|uniref:Uncharacterized protein n=1 Tax=Heliomicrobium gestii TaxID=2699 RepID=A0A845L4P6_HELGE|nr:hypothetical protein [Heliomicrobium gestii]MBM7865291.1 hypothetical protein [Heliomicrobium gestii]MZP41552.1 hypothetical protein [Heliomicrobium gestii]
MNPIKDQVFRIILEQGETTMDNLIVQMFGGSLISAGQMAELDQAVNALAAEGKVERNLLGLRPIARD